MNETLIIIIKMYCVFGLQHNYIPSGTAVAHVKHFVVIEKRLGGVVRSLQPLPLPSPRQEHSLMTVIYKLLSLIKGVLSISANLRGE